uniref:N-acetyltransferase domain-containing protein n=1 Tax=Tolypiocladia glomerulata TaxID=860646 RepID=A0A1Z1MU77_9FLOR|nr:hypothetical protein [Tolypiocladia glomerulata]ARW69643.1 hypothetical protein [Tolypiocladia glomerulata]
MEFFFQSEKLQQSKSKKKQDKKSLFMRTIHQDYEECIYLSTSNKVNLEELEKLCDSVGWVRRPIKKVKSALDNSFLTISVFHNRAENEKLIGFARVTSDGSFNATVWDVVIHPEFQGNGLGKFLMQEVIKQLRQYDISTITLFADPEVVSFYKHIGFIIDPDGVKGMFWYPT